MQNFLFPPFRLDPRNGQLWREQQVLSLKPKTFAVLEHLVTRAGLLVTKEELLDALWADVHVGDAVLKTCIREIRQTLGDDAKTPRFIETVHRRGYRFLPPITTTPPVLSSKFQASGSEGKNRNQLLGTWNVKPETLLVGREAELRRLHSWLEKALHGERQMVFVTGEAGIGKTSVVNTFLGQLAGRDDLWVARGQCLEQYGAGEAYLPLLTALGQLCREPAGERAKEILGRYAPTWLAQLPALLSPMELDALQRRVVGATHERMLREMAEAIEALTLDRGVILWIDDLQWSDYSTLDLLTALARRSQPARLLLIGAYRPVDIIVQNHPLSLVKQDLQLHGQCEELSLALLAETAVQEYFAVRFADHTEPAAPFQDLARLIHRRTQGNPLFMVNIADELVRQEVVVKRQGQWAVARKLEEVVVPAGIRQFIEQQVDQLSADLQRMLEAASVAGMEFSAAAVAAGVDAGVEEVETQCEELARRRQFFQTGGPGEWPDGTVAARYRFMHALYQQVVYERTPAGRCVSLHRRIGEREEAAYGRQATEVATELAIHFERGRDYPRAVHYLQQAGGNAMRRSAHQEAVALLTRGLEILKTLPNTPERAQQELMLQVALGAPLTATKGYAASEVEQIYSRARELCRQAGETPQLFPALLGLYGFYLVRAELSAAHELGELSLTLAERASDSTLLMLAHGTLGNPLFFLGELRRAREHLEQSIALYDFQQHHSYTLLYGNDPGVARLAYLSWVLWFLGFPDQALRRSRESLKLAQRLGDPFNRAFALCFAAWLHQVRREGVIAQELAESLIALSHEQGFPFWLAQGAFLRGWALAEQGHCQEGIRQMLQGEAGYEAIGAKIGRPLYLALLAQAYRKAGQTTEGFNAMTEALATAQNSGEHYYEAELYRLQGELTLQFRVQSPKFTVADPQLPIPDPQGEAEACFLKALDIARRQSAKSLELRAVMSLARLRQGQGKKDEARQLLAEVYNWFTEGFDTADLKDARALLQELS